MELDETDPAIWLKLEAATEEYIQKNCQLFKNVCERLVPRENEEKLIERLNSQQFSKSKPSNTGTCHQGLATRIRLTSNPSNFFPFVLLIIFFFFYSPRAR